MVVFGNIGPFDEKVELFDDYMERCDLLLVANRNEEVSFVFVWPKVQIDLGSQAIDPDIRPKGRDTSISGS